MGGGDVMAAARRTTGGDTYGVRPSMYAQAKRLGSHAVDGSSARQQVSEQPKCPPDEPGKNVVIGKESTLLLRKEKFTMDLIAHPGYDNDDDDMDDMMAEEVYYYDIQCKNFPDVAPACGNFRIAPRREREVRRARGCRGDIVSTSTPLRQYRGYYREYVNSFRQLRTAGRSLDWITRKRKRSPM